MRLLTRFNEAFDPFWMKTEGPDPGHQPVGKVKLLTSRRSGRVIAFSRLFSDRVTDQNGIFPILSVTAGSGDEKMKTRLKFLRIQRSFSAANRIFPTANSTAEREAMISRNAVAVNDATVSRFTYPSNPEEIRLPPDARFPPPQAG